MKGKAMAEGMAAKQNQETNLPGVIPSQCHVVLLAGGTSAERDISQASGDGAQAALIEAGFPVTRLNPALPDDMATLEEGARNHTFDVAFLCLHGKGGEDGTIQAKLEELGIPYTGSGVQASRTAIDKNATKEAYKRAELRTAPWIYLNSEQIARSQQMGVLDRLMANTVRVVGEKTVVKAVEQGSTQGLYIAETHDDLAECVLKALEYDDAVIIEKFIAGDEFTVAVLGNDKLEALPVIQIVPKSGFYDFDAKYQPGGSQHLCPAPVSDLLTEALQANAIEAHKALGCRGMSRTDIMVDADGLPWILETNTIPGMTRTSLLPDAARVAGISFAELCTKLVALALE